MNGCTNPAAVNYNPAADTEDYSCIYLEKVNGACHAFRDVDPAEVIDQSFTLSYSLISDDFVFFHDYVPDFYFSSRDKLYNIKDRKIYIHHEGPPGVYHNQNEKKSFFIDCVFREGSEMILNTVRWISEVLTQGKDNEFATFTHVTIWNSQQCSGRIALRDVFENLEYHVRKTQTIWSFNDFRDMLAQYGTQFLKDLFNNFAVDPSALNMSKPWYEMDLLHDSYFVVRLEFDNASGQQFIFHSAEVDVNQSPR